MKLKLVKQGEFLGTVCEFYVDEENNIYMSRTQIGYALEYKDPANAIKNIHNKNHERFDKYSVVLTGAQFKHSTQITFSFHHFVDTVEISTPYIFNHFTRWQA